MTLLRHTLLAGALGLAGSNAAAQSSENVVTKAEDAFGERIGIERIGLYSESQVRGFSLAEAGNYRIDGAYFVRAAQLADPIAAGVTTRVGYNALSSEFPAPSGIVDYRLRRPGSDTRLEVEAGMVAYGGGFAKLIGQTSTKDGGLGIAGGVQLQPHRHLASGARGSQNEIGLVPEWRISGVSSLTGLVSYRAYNYAGEFRTVLIDPVLPPKLQFPRKYTSSWNLSKQKDLNTGLIGRTRLGGFDLQASGFYSRSDFARSDFTLITSDKDGLGFATGVRSRPRFTASTSGEVKASHSLGKDHRVFAMIRARRTESQFRPGVLVDLGPVDQRFPTPPSIEPDAPPADPTIDLVRQIGAGIGYEGQIGSRLGLRAGVQRTSLRKSVSVPGELARLNEEASWLYDLAAIYRFSPNLTVFATATRGIEESGSAPANAANRDEVLPAVLARQYELGFRGRIADGLTLIGSAFEISKPTAGLDSSNVYRLVGDERHRGLELSLTGDVLPGLTTVAGVVVLEPKLSGQLVDLGLQSDRATGISSMLGVASFNYEVADFAGLSLDGQLTYESSRLLDPVYELETPDYWLVDLGGRYRFSIADQDALLRVYVGNIFDRNEWTALRSGSLMRTVPRSLRVTLTVAFD